MKKTEEAIQNKFLKLLDKYKIDEIDVNLICKSLDIRRQTFYYHYKNMYDVIYSIFYSKKLEPSNPKKLDSIFDDMVDFLFKDTLLYREINSSNARDVLNEFCESFIYRSSLIYLSSFNIPNDIRKEVAKYIGNTASYLILSFYNNEEMSKDAIKNRVKLYINSDSINKILTKLK